MSQENQSYLRFSLEESVWFQKGQEVAELLSISLDPNISIIENDQYVAIRGSLELTGEYKQFAEGEIEKEEEISSPKFVQSVEEREEGICEFLHRFPVDITIPNNRIQSLYDIDVTVDSFDYQLPERSCLKLVAELTISGLYGEQQNVPAEEDDSEREQGQEIGQSPIAEADSYEVNELDDFAEEESANEQEEISIYARYNQHEDDETDEEFDNRQPSLDTILSKPIYGVEDEIYKPFQAEAKKTPTKQAEAVEKHDLYEAETQPTEKYEVPEFVFNHDRETDRVHQSPSQQSQADQYPHTEEANNPHSEWDEETEQEEIVESSPSSTNLAELIKKKMTKKKSMSIAEFLGRKAANEEQVKLKVCIVQSGDTLESLSERYDIAVQNILRVNHIEANADVFEGQVLYIPVAGDNRISSGK